jgi:mRNA-degrading endonuclease toxin of MazEF toxin-antitoxin module
MAQFACVRSPLTSQLRGQRGEVDLGKPRWLPKHSAVNIQGLASFDRHKLARKLGSLTSEQYDQVKSALRDLLNLQ